MTTPRTPLRQQLVRSFVNGLILIGPVALTLYIAWRLFAWIDGWLRLPVPGVGFLVTIAAVTLFGFIASNFITRGALALVDQALGRLPFLRLVYTAIKDVLGAFVGEHRRFDRPVSVALFEGSDARVFGFLTQDSVAKFGLPDHVAVYLPQSYNFAGQLLVVPRDRVTPVDASSADVMTFVVSGGVATLHTGHTTELPAALPAPRG